MSAIIEKGELSYRKSDGTIVSDLNAVESFRGHTLHGDRYIGIYIHIDDEKGGAFHLFNPLFPVELYEIACFRYNDYAETTLADLENTCRTFTDSTFVLDEVADDLSILFIEYLKSGC